MLAQIPFSVCFTTSFCVAGLEAVQCRLHHPSNNTTERVSVTGASGEHAGEASCGSERLGARSDQPWSVRWLLL